MAHANPYFINPALVRSSHARLLTPADLRSNQAFVAYPNRDSTTFKEKYQIPEAETVVRGTLRYQGFPAFINALVELGFLNETAQAWLAPGASLAWVRLARCLAWGGMLTIRAERCDRQGYWRHRLLRDVRFLVRTFLRTADSVLLAAPFSPASPPSSSSPPPPRSSVSSRVSAGSVSSPPTRLPLAGTSSTLFAPRSRPRCSTRTESVTWSCSSTSLRSRTRMEARCVSFWRGGDRSELISMSRRFARRLSSTLELPSDPELVLRRWPSSLEFLAESPCSSSSMARSARRVSSRLVRPFLSFPGIGI